MAKPLRGLELPSPHLVQHTSHVDISVHYTNEHVGRCHILHIFYNF